MHFPAGFPGSALPTTLPFDVRTFLDSPKAAAVVCLTFLKGSPNEIARHLAGRSDATYRFRWRPKPLDQMVAEAAAEQCPNHPLVVAVVARHPYQQAALAARAALEPSSLLAEVV